MDFWSGQKENISIIGIILEMLECTEFLASGKIDKYKKLARNGQV